MTTAYDVPAADLIQKVAEKLKENEKINSPEWAGYVKTGVHKELPPADEDWWYTRCAAVLRKVYMDGPIGVERLRSVYGGKKDRGANPYKKMKGSGSVLRKSVQQLEDAGYIRKLKTGRIISPAGQSLLDNAAYETRVELSKDMPELAKY
ncbi:Ribosomal protein S19e [Methanosalsum zhilinae DSM 4017]|uniref:Small ribosomal subunit protein eS19 n=1 Tax=Methanosalsum zhilinae (strain DSM 4017 / NBRC 107636 / OCM 62 / WeN5) TaxID=679901 RepID=F7XQ40_METZD|nr:30S ribosomal protein S19e [Methanosalsum zhilinae]AEH60401.1 Ribosomal protein S19e [Methanosalsum zhilinae DSM 4017]